MLTAWDMGLIQTNEFVFIDVEMLPIAVSLEQIEFYHNDYFVIFLYCIIFTAFKWHVKDSSVKMIS